MSCEKEENLTRTEQVLQQITSQKLTLKQLENKNPKAFNKITSINQLKETKIQSKEVYSPVYDFYIDTSSILNIQVNNYNSYTFKIFRINDDSTVENLILSETPNGNYKTGIIKYTLTEDEKNKISNHQYIDLKSKMSYTQIDFNSLNDLNLHSRIECRDEERTVWVTCSEGVHNSSNIGTWNQCTADVPPTMYIAVSTVCESTGGNGGNTGTGNIDTSGSGGSNTGVDNQNTDTNPTDTNNNNNNTPINEFEDVITQPLLIDKTPIQLFMSNLSSEQLSWWNNASNNEEVLKISNYLEENGYNQGDRDFAKEIIDQNVKTGLKFDVELSKKSPAYIDFSEIDKTTPQGEKLDCIYNKLTNSPEFKRLFEGTFGGEQQKINVKFRMQPNLLSSNNLPSDGNCSPIEVLNGNYYTVITINSDILAGNLEKANILIAKTIIHEYLHAYLNLKYLDINHGASLSFLSNLQLEELMFYYFTPAIEHDFMFNQMIPVFQNILSEIITDLLSAQDIVDTNNYPITDTNGIVIENFNFMNFYKYLAYEGLHNSQSYQDSIANNPIELRKHLEYNRNGRNTSKDCQ